MPMFFYSLIDHHLFNISPGSILIFSLLFFRVLNEGYLQHFQAILQYPQLFPVLYGLSRCLNPRSRVAGSRQVFLLHQELPVTSFSLAFVTRPALLLPVFSYPCPWWSRPRCLELFAACPQTLPLALRLRVEDRWAHTRYPHWSSDVRIQTSPLGGPTSVPLFPRCPIWWSCLWACAQQPLQPSPECSALVFRG